MPRRALNAMRHGQIFSFHRGKIILTVGISREDHAARKGCDLLPDPLYDGHGIRIGKRPRGKIPLHIDHDQNILHILASLIYLFYYRIRIPLCQAAESTKKNKKAANFHSPLF